MVCVFLLIRSRNSTEAVTSNDRIQLTQLQLKRTQLVWHQINDQHQLNRKQCHLLTVSIIINCPNSSLLTRRLRYYLSFRLTAVPSPAKPRTTSKYDPANGNRTVGPSSGGGIIPRRSTTLYEKTSSTEKTNVVSTESK